MSSCAVISGIYGQDGYWLAQLLHARGYRVVGVAREIRVDFAGLEFAEIIGTDISDANSVRRLFDTFRPSEFYHLAAAHHSSEGQSTRSMRENMLRVNFIATQQILDALLEIVPGCRFLYAGSSQMFTASGEITYIDESSPYCPGTYYGFTKAIGAQLVDFLRRDRGLWGVTAILFNHESTRREPQYLSRKVTRAAASFALDSEPRPVDTKRKIAIRDIRARVDWSSAIDIVNAMHLSLRAERPTDYVFASGKLRPVEDLLDAAFSAVDLDWRLYVESEAGIAPQAGALLGVPRRAESVLGWRREVGFSQLIREMVAHDSRQIRNSSG